VVDASICNACYACVSPCPTGSIDHWLPVPKGKPFSIEEQFGWDELPSEDVARQRGADVAGVVADAEQPVARHRSTRHRRLRSMTRNLLSTTPRYRRPRRAHRGRPHTRTFTCTH